MSVRNSNSSRVSARYARRNNGLLLVRNFFLFALLLGGCFVLGFKVLAPMLTPNAKGSVSANGTLPAANADSATSGDDGSASESRSATARRSPSETDAPRASRPAQETPRVASRRTPADSTTLESTDGGTAVQSPDKPAPGTETATNGASGSVPGTTLEGATPGADGTETTPTRPGHRKNRRAANPDASLDSDATTPDATNTNPDLGSTDDINEDHSGSTRADTAAAGTDDASTAAVKPHKGYYRVQIGVFATREKADEEARRAQDQKLDATVIAIRKHGRILYRVQHAVYQKQENATAALQRLRDKGFDASMN